MQCLPLTFALAVFSNISRVQQKAELLDSGRGEGGYGRPEFFFYGSSDTEVRGEAKIKGVKGR